MDQKKEFCKIVANIFVSFIGAGVLGLPYAFKKSGLLEGAMVMTFVSFMAYKAMLLIIDCKYKILKELYDINPQKKKTKAVDNKAYMELAISDGSEAEDLIDNNNQKRESATSPSQGGTSEPKIAYADVGFAAFGMSGRLIVEFSLLTSQIGFCCAYLIFITENLTSFFPDVRQSSWLVALLPFLLLLTLIKDLSRFAIFSIFAQASNIFAFAVVYWFDFQHLHLAQVEPKNFNLAGLPYFFSVAIYCFEGAGMILSLEESVGKEKRERFPNYLRLTLLAITLLYVTFGGAGYLSYGPDTNEIITLNLPHDGSFNFAILVKCCLCTSLFFTYPVMLFPVFSILEKKLGIDTNKPSNDGCSISTPILIMKVSVVALTGLIVTMVPNFGQLMALVGATCCNLLAYILPALAHLVLFRNELQMADKCLDGTLLVVGIVSSIAGTLDLLR